MNWVFLIVLFTLLIFIGHFASSGTYIARGAEDPRLKERKPGKGAPYGRRGKGGRKGTPV